MARRWATINDNAERFALFCRAVLESAKMLGTPDAVFALPRLADGPDSHTAQDAVRRRPGVCEYSQRLHHSQYRIPGNLSARVLPLLMLPWDLFTMSKLEFYGKVNFLKGAITMADYITTVSRKYSQEIQTAEYGFGLEGVLRARSTTVTGILNAVNYGEWSPENDRFIAVHYSAADLSGKAKCKADLLKEFGMAENTQLPVVGMVSRFAARKDSILFSRWPIAWPGRTSSWWCWAAATVSMKSCSAN